MKMKKVMAMRKILIFLSFVFLAPTFVTKALQSSWTSLLEDHIPFMPGLKKGPFQYIYRKRLCTERQPDEPVLTLVPTQECSPPLSKVAHAVMLLLKKFSIAIQNKYK